MHGHLRQTAFVRLQRVDRFCKSNVPQAHLTSEAVEKSRELVAEQRDEGE